MQIRNNVITQSNKRKLRVCAYCRVSTESEEEISKTAALLDFIQNQPHNLTEFDEVIVKKWISQITVWGDHFTVELKSGVKIEIDD